MLNVQIRAPLSVRQPGVVVVTGITIGVRPWGVSTIEFVAVDMYAARLAALLVFRDGGIVIEIVDSAVITLDGDAAGAAGGIVTLRRAQPLTNRATLKARSLRFIVHLGEQYG